MDGQNTAVSLLNKQQISNVKVVFSVLLVFKQSDFKKLMSGFVSLETLSIENVAQADASQYLQGETFVLLQEPVFQG